MQLKQGNLKAGLKSGAKYRLAVGVPMSAIKLVLHDEDNRPLPKAQYTLKVAGETIQGVTNDQGVLEESIPSNAAEAELSFSFEHKGKTITRVWPLQLTD